MILKHEGLSMTKEGRRTYMRKYRQENLDRFAEHKRNNRETENRAIRKWKWKNKHKTKAHAIVYLAIKAGALIRGRCEICNSSKVDAHHDDYTKPLDVRWLCHKHHMGLHMLEKQTNG